MSVIRTDLRSKGCSFVPGAALRIGPEARDSAAELASEWENLELDNYLKNGARFRERRYGRFYYLPRTNSIRLLKHRPYFQSKDANAYAGGIHREVAPLTDSSVKNPLMNTLIEFNFAQFPVDADDERLDQPWEVACHQFRIIATADELGEPTPEGIHRDDIDFGAIHLMSRSNVAGGNSLVYDNSKNLIAEYCLRSRLDTLFWADHQVLHSVTPITPEDASARGVRDILILGYRCTFDLLETD